MKTLLNPSRRCGFTLVELLLAMAILGLLVLMLAQMFNETTRAFQVGEVKVANNSDGRGILDFIAREMQQAIGNSDWFFSVEQNAEGSKVNFMMLGNKPTSGRRSMQAIKYYLNGGGPYELMRYVMTDAGDIGNDVFQQPGWRAGKYVNSKGTSSLVADNISEFSVYCEGVKIGNWLSEANDNKLPVFADVRLGLDMSDATDSALVRVYSRGLDQTDDGGDKEDDIVSW